MSEVSSPVSSRPRRQSSQKAAELFKQIGNDEDAVEVDREEDFVIAKRERPTIPKPITSEGPAGSGEKRKRGRPRKHELPDGAFTTEGEGGEALPTEAAQPAVGELPTNPPPQQGGGVYLPPTSYLPTTGTENGHHQPSYDQPLAPPSITTQGEAHGEEEQGQEKKQKIEEGPTTTESTDTDLLLPITPTATEGEKEGATGEGGATSTTAAEQLST